MSKGLMRSKTEDRASHLVLGLLTVLMAGMAWAQVPATRPATEPSQEQSSWLEQVRKPTPWLALSGDLRLREIYFRNATTFNDQSDFNDQHQQKARTRLRAIATPVENLDIVARIVWEFTNFCEPAGPDSLRSFNADEAFFDNLFVRVKQTFGLPNTLSIGRQDFVGPSGPGTGPKPVPAYLQGFGDGWLIYEGTPLDTTRSFYFDAIRNTLELTDAKSSLDLIYIEQAGHGDGHITPFNNQERALVEENERGAIAYFKNNSLQRTQLDGYFIYKHSEAIRANGYSGDEFTFGARAEHDFDEHWQAKAEFAEQLGERNDATVCATGFNSKLTYFFRDPLKQDLHIAYEYLSGDDPETDKTEQFNLPWGRGTQWSDLILFTYVPETRFAQVTNMHRIGMGWSCSPHDVVNLSATYHLLFADQNPQGNAAISETESFRGQLVRLLMKYKFSEHISGHLVGDIMFPGNFYANDDPALYVRYELLISW